jgi:16S rRNA (uracil1498-N3)-methyltransferase
MSETIRTRLYHPNAGLPELIADDPDTLGVAKSMRLQPGDWFGCFNGDGKENTYTVTSTEKRMLTATLQSSEENPRDPKHELTVLLASTKGKTKDQMVKELTALGATSIIIYHAVRSVSLPETNKTEHLQKVAVEACRQCERSTIPTVEIAPHFLHQLDKDVFQNQLICFYERSNQDDLPAIENQESPITLVFGPEGGFTDEEIALLQKHDAKLCSLGRRILRAELAVSVGATLVQYQRKSL